MDKAEAQEFADKIFSNMCGEGKAREMTDLLSYRISSSGNDFKRNFDLKQPAKKQWKLPEGNAMAYIPEHYFIMAVENEGRCFMKEARTFQANAKITDDTMTQLMKKKPTQGIL